MGAQVSCYPFHSCLVHRARSRSTLDILYSSRSGGSATLETRFPHNIVLVSDVSIYSTTHRQWEAAHSYSDTSSSSSRGYFYSRVYSSRASLNGNTYLWCDLSSRTAYDASIYTESPLLLDFNYRSELFLFYYTEYDGYAIALSLSHSSIVLFCCEIDV